MHSLSLLHGIFPTQGSNPGLPHCGWILYQLSYRGSPRILEWVIYPFSRGSSWPRNQTGVSCIVGGFFTNWAIREALNKGKTHTNLHDPRTRRDFGDGDTMLFAEKHTVTSPTETLCPFFFWKSPHLYVNIPIKADLSDMKLEVNQHILLCFEESHFATACSFAAFLIKRACSSEQVW